MITVEMKDGSVFQPVGNAKVEIRDGEVIVKWKVGRERTFRAKLEDVKTLTCGEPWLR